MSIFSINPDKQYEIIDSTEEDLIVTNRDGVIVQASRISGRHYGVTPESLLGRSVYDLEREKVFVPAITPLVLKEKKKVVLVQDTPNGTRELILGFPLFDEAGEVEYVISYSCEWSELVVIQGYLSELEAEMALMKEELDLLRREAAVPEGLVLASRPTAEAFARGLEAAELEVPILLYGEHGTGKATLAREIHGNSGRSEGAFLTLDCRTIPEALFERELAGDADGKIGMLQVAEGGTLYLEGIDRLSPYLQNRLAGWMKDKKYQAEGADVPFDVRIIASAEGELSEAVRDGAFSRELYYLIHLVPIELRPLMERKEDLAALIPLFQDRFCEKHGVRKELSQELFEHLLECPWPGNIDELANVMERLVIGGRSNVLTPDDLPMEYRVAAGDSLTEIEVDGRTLPSILESVEKRVLMAAKQRYGTTTEMAKRLGISQPSVVRKLKKYEED
ncbi:sigma 54-interacting transcriptional regulator [Bhargavaea massiliensis]|uniref:sigma 54-interacting transcriptional regulator n=1 Tax=Bhargavaea massiliensis TaxID=2697500 RepID=UPI001BCA9170|nr:sigma 54-interacting transcriptional regulator [Bhargavaea massiliensis]